jgi:RNA polymerase sigma-70 factor (ECF subfamily)
VAAAVDGNRVALERLLLANYDDLSRQIAAKLPARLQATQAVEDILQQTFLQAFRDVQRFEPRSDASFGDWLSRIAENRLLDSIKMHDRQKRGGNWGRVGEGSPDDSRLAPLLDWIAGAEAPPSSIVARAEALQALTVAIASLEQDQREAIRLRLLENMSLEETAAALGRSPDAVRGLIHRGKHKLKDAMGRASQWLSAK